MAVKYFCDLCETEMSLSDYDYRISNYEYNSCICENCQSYDHLIKRIILYKKEEALKEIDKLQIEYNRTLKTFLQENKDG